MKNILEKLAEDFKKEYDKSGLNDLIKKIAPKSPYVLAVKHFEAGDIPKATEAFKKCLDIYAPHTIFYSAEKLASCSNFLGIIAATSEESLPVVINYLEDAHHYSPNNQVYVRNLAGAHLLNKGRVMSKHYFTKCINIPPEDKSYTVEMTAECTKFLGIIAQEMTEL
jgi:hypothetical protein